jgi:prepilin-type N-terminal cleavage/methylation domain-containing protein
MVRAMRNERGFTLPELLVAMVLTLIVTGGALTALQDANRAAEIGAVLTDVNQNLRVAMNLIIKDLIQAGEGVRLGVPVPSGAGADPIRRPGPTGMDWNFEETWTTLPAVVPGPEIGTIINDIQTDALTVLYEDHRLNLTGVYPVLATDGSAATFPMSFPIGNGANAIQEGDLLMFTAGGARAVQEVTGVAGQVVQFATSADSKLNQRTAPAGTIMMLQNDDGTWPPQVEVRRLTMVSYYLYVPTSGPITSPHLVRRVNYGDERVVALGIENLQLSWDLVDEDTNPTNVDVLAPENSPNQIRKANLYVEARSMSEYSRTRQYLRTKLTTAVSLRSMAFKSLYNLQ